MADTAVLVEARTTTGQQRRLAPVRDAVDEAPLGGSEAEATDR